MKISFFACISCLFFSLFLRAPVYAQEVVFDGLLDGQTVDKGITITAKKGCAIGIAPHALKGGARLVVKHEETGSHPERWDRVGDVFSYRFFSDKLEKPIVVTCETKDPEVRLFVFDETSRSWRQAPLHRGKNTLYVRLPNIEKRIALFRKAPWVTEDTLTSARLPVSSALLVDEAGRTLFSQNDGKTYSVASLTKLMTALVFLDHNPGLQKKITILKKDDSEPAKVPLVAGDVVTVKDLFNATLVGSRNNTAQALARSTGLSKKQFVTKMNAKAKSFGLTGTVFSDVSGLDPGNRSTARDIYRLAHVAFSNKLIRDTLNKKRYVLVTANKRKKFTIKNTNPFIGSSSLLKEGKTGFINEAGYNFVVHARSGDKGVIAVIFGASDSKARFDIARDLVVAGLTRQKIVSR